MGIFLSQAYGACPISASVVTAKGSFFADEPIAIGVSFRNDSNLAASVFVDYPFLGGDGAPGISFTPGGGLSRSHWASVTRLGGISATREVRPASTLEFTIYLQTFVTGLTPGNHRIPYNLQFSCLSGEQRDTGTASGDLAVRIVPGASPSLQADLASYESRVENARGFDQLAALGALLATPDAKVITVLGRILKLGYTAEVSAALVKFADNPEAATLISSNLHNTKATTVAAALRGLELEQYMLPPAEVAGLMQSGDETVQLATVSYVQGTRNQEYRSIIESYATGKGAHGRVAAAAGRALTVIAPKK